MKKKTMCGLIIAAAMVMITAVPIAAQDFQTGPDGTGGVVLIRYTGNEASVVIPAAIDGKPVTYIGAEAFSNCTGLVSVTIPASVTSIDEGAFYGCTGLMTIAIPDSVTSIGDVAFSGCTSLTAVTIPASVTSISYGTFYGCTSLTAITVSAANQQYKDIEGVLFTRDGKTLHSYPAGGEKAYRIPDGVTSIGDYAFAGCTGLTSVTIPASVTSIGDWAFYNCDNLDKASRDAIVKRFGDGVFLHTGAPVPKPWSNN
jgi:hypothetical protein